jgi:hypothetical protein
LPFFQKLPHLSRSITCQRARFYESDFCRCPNPRSKAPLSHRASNCHHDDEGLSVYPVFAKSAASACARSRTPDAWL